MGNVKCFMFVCYVHMRALFGFIKLVKTPTQLHSILSRFTSLFFLPKKKICTLKFYEMQFEGPFLRVPCLSAKNGRRCSCSSFGSYCFQCWVSFGKKGLMHSFMRARCISFSTLFFFGLFSIWKKKTFLPLCAKLCREFKKNREMLKNEFFACFLVFTFFFDLPRYFFMLCTYNG